MRVNDIPHHSWICISSDGVIIAAHCDCMAGLGESCSHVAALLFKIEAAVRLGYTSMACTEMPCEWNNHFVKKVNCQPISRINFYTSEYIGKIKNTVKQQDPVDEPDEELRKQFLMSISASGCSSICLSLFKDTADKFKSVRPPTAKQCVKLPMLLRDLYDENNCTLSSQELAEKCASVALQVTSQQNEYLDSCTATQSMSVLWHEHRAGHITASAAHDVLHTNQCQPSLSIIKRIVIPNAKQINSASLNHGRENEKLVFDYYSTTGASQLHTGVVVSQTGMRISVEKPWLAASADGIFICDCHGRGVLEIKAPYKWRHCQPEEAWKDNEFYLDVSGQLKPIHRYYTQVQLQMYVYNVTVCDFVVYFESAHKTNVETIERNEDFISSMLPKLDTFWQRHILPELLTRKLENSVEKDSVPSDGANIYCYCQNSYKEGEVMVGCDNSGCPYGGWIHLTCIRPKRKTVPKGLWLCKTCKQKK